MVDDVDDLCWSIDLGRSFVVYEDELRASLGVFGPGTADHKERRRVEEGYYPEAYVVGSWEAYRVDDRDPDRSRGVAEQEDSLVVVFALVAYRGVPFQEEAYHNLEVVGNRRAWRVEGSTSGVDHRACMDYYG